MIMTLSPQDKLARLLAGRDAKTSDSASLQLPAASLDLVVAGIGAIELPLRPIQAKKLISLARPAHFGKGERTVHDASVRDTWELTPAQVSLGGDRWSETLADALEQLGSDLGLPPTTQLRADLHSFLVYGKGQFFAPHQDSEKHDDMIATLVVSLPSAHSGGELVIDDRGALRQYRGSRDELVFVAFYADRRHEVLPVRTGFRATLTFNVLVAESEPTPPQPGELAAAMLRQYFTTTVISPYGNRDLGEPVRLAFLLDHEYSQHGLGRGRLKGTDARRVAVLRTAARAIDCECVLALAHIHETWDATPSMGHGGSRYRYGYYEQEDDFDDDNDFDDEGGLDDDAYELNELVDGDITLTWWTDDQCPGEINLSIDDHEVCAVTPTSSRTPYASEYEGYMGNYGNTIDRWYHRAALVIWPTQQAFRNRTEASPGWALRQVLSSLEKDDLDRARSQARELIDHRGSVPPVLFHFSLEAALGVRDSDLAGSLLAPFDVTTLSEKDATVFTALVEQYPESWWLALRESWDRRAGYAGHGRREWIETQLPLVVRALDSAAGTPADRLTGWAWGWLRGRLHPLLTYPNATLREERLADLGPALAAVLSTAGLGLQTQIGSELADLDDVALPVILSALHSCQPTALPALTGLAESLRGRLTRQLAQPERATGDWSIDWTSLGGQDPDRLAAFLHSPTEQRLLWPLAEQRRRQIHSLIDQAGLPVRHTTQRSGRPFTLVLEKTDELFTREADRRRRTQDHLAWLDATFGFSGRSPSDAPPTPR